ncbi:DUF6498-containing protein [Sulfurimonas diazotrophicus]|uniref:DUF6498-containing protein n=1 Tax=Sulfurimonas diazotrophicus TaxID=3131939 RepID=A0ABZ3H7D6_9BACT
MALLFTLLRRYASLPLFVLLAANLYPLYGVLELGWGVFELIFLYWMENIVIGFFNVLKMIANRPEELAGNLGKLFLVPFFIFHYGMFAYAHGIFVIALFAPEELHLNVFGLADYIYHRDVLFGNGILTALTLLIVSHAVSFYVDYVRSGEYERTTLSDWMGAPYGRVAVLHIGLIGGGFLVAALGQPLAALIVLLFLKVGMDARSLALRHASVQRKHPVD